MVVSTEARDRAGISSIPNPTEDRNDSSWILVRRMQRLNFGRIERLTVRDGQPVFEPSPRFVREIKLAGESRPRPELDREGFAPKAQVVHLFEVLSEFGCGVVDLIEVKNGLPFRIVVDEPL